MRAIEDPSLRRLAGITEHMVDERVGVVRYVSELPRDAGAPDFFHFYALASNTRAFTLQENFSAAGGASSDRGHAVAKALGEAVERYASAIFEVEELPLTSRSAAPFSCAPPSAFALYSREQHESPGFPYVPFDDDTPIRWTPAVDPLTCATCHVPAAMVFVPYFFYVGTGDAPICQPISTGLACHCSAAEAAISGLCEVIERDAFMITWQAGLNPPQIRVETLSDENHDLVQRFERTGASVTLFDITMDVGVPTVLATLRSPAASAPAFVAAASTSLDPEEAVRKSLEELAHTRRYSQQIKTLLPRLTPDPPRHENVAGQISHLNFWCDAANAPGAGFLFTSKIRIDFEEMVSLKTGSARRDLDLLCRKVSALGHQALIADVTTPDVAGLGLHVVHALIPGFHPLFLGHSVRALGGRRLYEAPQRLGYKGITPASGALSLPHPYP